MTMKLTKAENEVIEAYRLSGVTPAALTYARRALVLANPDVLVMLDENEIYDDMVKMKIIRESASPSKLRGKVKYHLRQFLSWLNSEFENGQHADTWFEPEWMEKNI